MGKMWRNVEGLLWTVVALFQSLVSILRHPQAPSGILGQFQRQQAEAGSNSEPRENIDKCQGSSEWRQRWSLFSSSLPFWTMISTQLHIRTSRGRRGAGNNSPTNSCKVVRLADSSVLDHVDGVVPSHITEIGNFSNQSSWIYLRAPATRRARISLPRVPQVPPLPGKHGVLPPY